MRTRQLVAGIAVLATFLVVAAPASAGVGISASMSLPSGMGVGQTGLAGSFTVTNTNTPPNDAETNNVVALRLALSCGTTSTVADLCSVPDLGVFAIDASASGAGGSACAGVSFTVSAPDASGAVTFTPAGTVALPPPGGTNQCTVNFTFSVLKMPTIDVAPGSPGVQTRANLLATTQGTVSGLTVSSRPSVVVTVLQGVPTIATVASQNRAARTIADTATITVPAGSPAPTGTVLFTVYGPNDATCSGPVFASSTNAVGGGSATSSNFSVTQPGTYRFVAAYSGDANYFAVTSPCNAPGETVYVRSSVADFDDNGTSDRSVYLDGGWYVHNQSTVFFGLAGDISVPADYDGDGDTDRAVYRNGAWYVHNQTTVNLGLSSHVPVPGDYNKDGDAERAVYDPATGAWYVEGEATVFLGGAAGDIPVPGDYDGDGDTDRAIYRGGTWYVDGQTPVSLGLPGYIPVPGDYDNDGDTDRAVFLDGAWYVHNQATVFFGLAGDIPEPADYDGDGDTDRAVYRDGAWYVHNQSTVFFGLAGYIPVPLPHAIYDPSFGT